MTHYEIVWKVLTLPCRESARLSSEALDRPLAWHDALAVRLHTLLCTSCRRYRSQILALRKVSTRLAEQVDPPGPRLPDHVRDRIKRDILSD